MNWVKRWNTWVSETPVATGVWKCKDGGHLVRARVTSEKTGQQREVRKVLPETQTVAEAVVVLRELVEEARTGREKVERQIPRLKEFVACLIEEKMLVHADHRGFKSASTRASWKSILKLHILPRFGDVYLDKLEYADIRAWQLDMGREIACGDLSPRTANDRLGKLHVIVTEAVARYQLPRDPMAMVRTFSTAEHPTYTEESPNALTPDEVERFLSTAKELFPQYFAFFVIGFATGLRPSSIRTLRWKGTEPDVLFDKQMLLVRRSHTRKSHVMLCPKNAKGQRIAVPQSIIDLIRWHTENVLTQKQRESSDLLFPGKRGGFLDATVVARKIPRLLERAGINHHVTQRAWRRTFNDLARLAHMDHLVIRSVSGHSSEAMRGLYSTVQANEQREGLSRVVEMAGFEQVLGGLRTGMQALHASQPHGETRAEIN